MELTPTPKDLAEARDLPRAVLLRFVARYRELVDQSARARELSALDPHTLERWADLENWLKVDIETALVRAILYTANDPEVEHAIRPECKPWPNRGIIVGGQLYAAVVDPNRLGDAGNDRVHMMRLVVVDRANILDLDRPSGAL